MRKGKKKYGKENKSGKNVKVEWCENWIKALFKEEAPDGGYIPAGHFWSLADKSGFCGITSRDYTAMNEALANLTDIEWEVDGDGELLYSKFRLKA